MPVMRSLRDNTKWIMLLLTVAFVAWLVFDWVQGGEVFQSAAANPTVGVVNDREIQYVEWNEYMQAHLDRAREQVDGGLSDEERHQLRENAWQQLVNEILIEQELERLGLEATEEEIRQAFRTSPPPFLRDHPAFRTDGRFDFEKYQQFFANPAVDDQLLFQIEQYYRDVIPRTKLLSMVVEEVSVTDRDLWTYFRDRNETAAVRYVSVDPLEVVSRDEVEVTDEEIRRYYRENRNEFRSPASAVVDIVSLRIEPSSADSAAALATADSLFSLLDAGEREFEELMQAAEAGDLPGVEAMDLGSLQRGDLIAPLEEAAFTAPVGEVTGPVSSPAGLHLLHVFDRDADRVALRQLMVPIRLSSDAEAELFRKMDDVEDIALWEDLRTAADSLDVTIRTEVVLEEGSEFIPGVGPLGVAVSWALDPETPRGDLSQYFENPQGHHILELLDRRDGGVRDLEEVRGTIRDRLLREARLAAAREELERVGAGLAAGEITLDELAERHGWSVEETGEFTRTESVSGLGRNTPAVGAAFGLSVGGAGGPYEARDRFVFLEVLDRSEVSQEAFETAREQLRLEVENQRRQQHLTRWLEALREDAEIMDRRDRATRGLRQGS